MQTNVNYFPEGLALGKAFLNREVERNTLTQRIHSTQHTVLMAPRRYGKTSLVMQVIQDLKVCHASIDFLTTYSEDNIRDRIAFQIERLALTLLPNIHKAKEKLLSVFKRMKPELTFSAFGQRLSLQLGAEPLQAISDLLERLDETAAHFEKKVVIFMDEFQQISQVKNYHAIEAAIRHSVERSQHIAYVFAGSQRQLLSQMFAEYGRPLYRLCQVLPIHRMEKTVYVPRFRKLAKEKWHTALSHETMERIFEKTELHPFYTNVLCQALWREKTLVTPEQVDFVWHTYVHTQRHVVNHDLMNLSLNQRKVILALAKSPTQAIQSVDFTAPLKISTSSAQQALETLMRKDLVEIDPQGFYRVLDPAMRYYLNPCDIDI